MPKACSGRLIVHLNQAWGRAIRSILYAMYLLHADFYRYDYTGRPLHLR